MFSGPYIYWAFLAFLELSSKYNFLKANKKCMGRHPFERVGRDTPNQYFFFLGLMGLQSDFVTLVNIHAIL